MTNRPALLALLLILLSGCSSHSLPQIGFEVISIRQESYAESESNEAQVWFNVTLAISNVGKAGYVLSPDDWHFVTDVGTIATPKAWVRLGVPDESQPIKPGQTSTFFFHAWSLGKDHGNITHIQFRDEPWQAV